MSLLPFAVVTLFFLLYAGDFYNWYYWRHVWFACHYVVELALVLIWIFADIEVRRAFLR